jgi:hypothetical protein
MPHNPIDVIYPQNRISHVVEVLHDGTVNEPNEFSIARIQLNNGVIVNGIRYNMNEWNEDNPDIGYPTCRPGNPTWFILPEIEDLLPVLNNVFKV